MTLTTLKEEARAEFADHFLYHPAGVWRDGKILKPDFRPLTFDNVNKFLDSLIDHTYHATKEEVRGEVRKIKTWVFTAPYGLEMEDGVVVPRKRTDDEYVKVSELRATLEDTTTSPNL